MSRNIINEWRIESGHTFEEMSVRCGVSQAHIFNISTGKSKLSEKLSIVIQAMRQKESLIRNNVPDRMLLEYEIRTIRQNNIEARDGSNLEFVPKKKISKAKCVDCGGSGADETGQDFCRTCRGLGTGFATSPMGVMRRKIKALDEELRVNDKLLSMATADTKKLTEFSCKNIAMKEIIECQRREISKLKGLGIVRSMDEIELGKILNEACLIIDNIWTSRGGVMAQSFKNSYKYLFNGL